MNTTIMCPQTGAALNFEIPGDEETLADYWSRELQIDCPMCEALHIVPYRNAYVASILSKFTCMPADIQEATVH